MTRDNEVFITNAKKLTERLIVIFQHNPSQHLDPCETDILLIEELVDFFDKSTLPWVRNADIESEDYVQTRIFDDTKT